MNSDTKELIIESKKHGTHAVLIDKEDWDKVSQYKWCLSLHHTGRFYVRAKIYHPEGGYRVRPDNGYRQRRQTTIRLHRLIMGAEKGDIIDHIDGDSLNNTKANLRYCDANQSAQNRKLPVTNKSGFKGVHHVPDRDPPWVAQIQSHGKKIYLGSYATAEEAARVYDRKAIELHGEFAVLNFHKEDYL